MRIRVVLDALAVLVLAFGAGGNLAAGAWTLPPWLPAWLGWTILLTSVTPILLRRWCAPARGAGRPLPADERPAAPAGAGGPAPRLRRRARADRRGRADRRAGAGG